MKVTCFLYSSVVTVAKIISDLRFGHKLAPLIMIFRYSEM